MAYPQKSQGWSIQTSPMTHVAIPNKYTSHAKLEGIHKSNTHYQTTHKTTYQ